MPSFTKKAIKEAFIKLLEQYPLKQISVKDIVEECGINRNSLHRLTRAHSPLSCAMDK